MMAYSEKVGITKGMLSSPLKVALEVEMLNVLPFKYALLKLVAVSLAWLGPSWNKTEATVDAAVLKLAVKESVSERTSITMLVVEEMAIFSSVADCGQSTRPTRRKASISMVRWQKKQLNKNKLNMQIKSEYKTTANK